MHSITSSIRRLLRRQWGWSPHAPLWLSRTGSFQKLHPSVAATVRNSNNISSLAQHWASRISSCPSQVKPGLRVRLYPCPPVPCPLILRGKIASWGLRWTAYVPSPQRNPFLHPTLRDDTTFGLLGKTTLFQHVLPLTRAVLGMNKLPSSFARPLTSRELHAQGILQHPSVSEGLVLLKDGVL